MFKFAKSSVVEDFCHFDALGEADSTPENSWGQFPILVERSSPVTSLCRKLKI